MKTNKKQPIHTVILNLIQDLQRSLLSLINDIRGRFQDPVLRHYGAGPTVMPQFGMTPLFSNGGFTLIELLVVVLIIGILAAVALPQYQLAVTKAHTSTMLTTLKNIANANEIYYLSSGDYTNNMQALDVSISAQCTQNNLAPYTYNCDRYFLVNFDRWKTNVSAAYCPGFTHTGWETCTDNGKFYIAFFYPHLKSESETLNRWKGSWRCIVLNQSSIGQKVCNSSSFN